MQQHLTPASLIGSELPSPAAQGAEGLLFAPVDSSTVGHDGSGGEEISFIPRGPGGDNALFVRSGGPVDINSELDLETWRIRFSAMRIALNHPTVPVPARNEARDILTTLDQQVQIRLPLPLFRVVVQVAGTLADQAIQASDSSNDTLARALTMLYRLTWPVLSGGDILEQQRRLLG